jgi:superfamily II DNA or RNA helicase
MNKCTIILNDEVNCKVTGLDLKLRAHLVKSFSRIIPGMQYIPSVRLGRWDGKKKFFSDGGNTFVNLLDQIIPIIDRYNYDIEVVDNRVNKHQFEFDLIDENKYAHLCWPVGHENAGQPIKLRDYQVNMVNTFLNNPQSIYCAGTGSGKTISAMAMSHSVEKYGRTIVIVPNKSLVTQTERDYKLGKLDVGVWFGDRKEFGHKHTICTWQSLNVLLKKKKNRPVEEELLEGISIDDILKDVVAVIVDECHTISAAVLLELLTGVFANVPIRWGLSGTMPKDEHDWWCLLTSIGPLAGTIAASELQEQGVLSNCHVFVKQLIDYGDYQNYQNELKYLVGDVDRVTYIAGLIKEISKTGNTLVLIDRIETGELLESLIPNSVFLSGRDKVSKRKVHYDAIELEDNKTLIATSQIAAVGISIVRLNNLVLLEAGKSFTKTIQSIGRGLRKGFDKDFVNIFDVTSTCKYSKRHLGKRKTYYTEAKYPFSIEKIKWS